MPKAILLADDSLTIQKVVELTFSDGDYVLTSVGNGIEAVEALGRMQPDLVIADVVMPGKNGYEVCEAVRANPATASIPVILLSGTFEPFDRDRAEKARANAIVTKPFDSKNLLAQVEALIGGAAAAPEVSPFISPAKTSEISSPTIPLSVAGVSADTGQFFPEELQTPAEEPMAVEPVMHDIEKSIAEYERRLTGSAPLDQIDPMEIFEDAEPAERVEPAAEFEPPRPRPEAHRVEPLEFEMDDTSPFGRGVSGHRPPPIEPPAFVAPDAPADNVFDFPGASEPEPPRKEELRPSESAVFTESEPPVDFFTPPPLMADTGDAPEPVTPLAAPEPPAAAPVPAGAASEPVPPELERLAHDASISDLARMVHQVAPGTALSDEDLDRLCRKVVERLSEKVVRDIAWEVVPDVAEIVVRKRIEELEAEAPRESK